MEKKESPKKSGFAKPKLAGKFQQKLI